MEGQNLFFRILCRGCLGGERGARAAAPDLAGILVVRRLAVFRSAVERFGRCVSGAWVGWTMRGGRCGGLKVVFILVTTEQTIAGLLTELLILFFLLSFIVFCNKF